MLYGLSECRQDLDGARQLMHMMDQLVRLQRGDRHLGIAKADADHRDSGAAGDADIGSRVAHHDGGGKLALGARHR